MRGARGESLPELAGIPVTIKDNRDTTGTPTTSGSLIFKDGVPVRDHFPVARLRKAGAVIISKTTVPEFANGIMTPGPPHTGEPEPLGSDADARGIQRRGCRARGRRCRLVHARDGMAVAQSGRPVRAPAWWG